MRNGAKEEGGCTHCIHQPTQAQQPTAEMEDQPREADLLLELPTYLAEVALEVEQRKGATIKDIYSKGIKKQMYSGSGRLCECSTKDQSQLC